MTLRNRITELEREACGADTCQSCGWPIPPSPLTREHVAARVASGLPAFAAIVLDGPPPREPDACPTCGRRFTFGGRVSFDGDREISEAR